MNPGRRTDFERHEINLGIVRRRTNDGASAADIAVELRCTDRTVQRYRAEIRLAGQPLTATGRPLGVTHGLPGTYRSGCKCDPCRTANARYCRETRHRGVIRSHGASGYQRGCKCATCRDWGSEHNRRARQRRLERQRAAA